MPPLKLPKFLPARFARWEEHDDYTPPLLVIHTQSPRCIFAIEEITNPQGEITNIKAHPAQWLDPEPDAATASELAATARKFHYHHITYSAKQFDEKFTEELRTLYHS